MVINHQSGTGRKATGGRYSTRKSKKAHASGSTPSNTTIGPKKVITARGMGGNTKAKVAKIAEISVIDQKTKKHSKATIKRVLESPANRHFVRRNILTKGTIVETDKGKAKITSRPGQDGTVNAILVK